MVQQYCLCHKTFTLDYGSKLHIKRYCLHMKMTSNIVCMFSFWFPSLIGEKVSLVLCGKTATLSPTIEMVNKLNNKAALDHMWRRWSVKREWTFIIKLPPRRYCFDVNWQSSHDWQRLLYTLSCWSSFDFPPWNSKFKVESLMMIVGHELTKSKFQVVREYTIRLALALSPSASLELLLYWHTPPKQEFTVNMADKNVK